MQKREKPNCTNGFPCKLVCIPRNNNCLGKLSDRSNKEIRVFSNLIGRITSDNVEIDINKLNDLPKCDRGKVLLILDITGNLPKELPLELANELQKAKEAEATKKGLKYDKKGEDNFNERRKTMESSILKGIDELEKQYRDKLPEDTNVLKYLGEQSINNPNFFKDNPKAGLLFNRVLEEKYRYDSLINAYLNVRLAPSRKNRKDEMTPEGFNRYDELYKLDEDGKKLENYLPDDKLKNGTINPKGTEDWLKNRQNNLIKIQMLESLGIEVTKENIKNLGYNNELNINEDSLRKDAEVLLGVCKDLSRTNGSPGKPDWGSKGDRRIDLVLMSFLRQGGLDIHDGSPLNINESSVEHIFPNGSPKSVEAIDDINNPPSPPNYLIGSTRIIAKNIKELNEQKQLYLDSPPNVGLSREKINKIKSGNGGSAFDNGVQANKLFNKIKVPKLINNEKNNKNIDSYLGKLNIILDKLGEIDKLDTSIISKAKNYIEKNIFTISKDGKKKLLNIKKFAEIVESDKNLTDDEKRVIMKAVHIQLTSDYINEKSDKLPTSDTHDIEIDPTKEGIDIEYMNQVVLNPLFYADDKDIRADLIEGVNKPQTPEEISENNDIAQENLDFLKELRYGVKLEKPLESDEAAMAVLQVLGINRGYSPDKPPYVVLGLRGLPNERGRGHAEASLSSIAILDAIFNKNKHLSASEKLEIIPKLDKVREEVVGKSSSLRGILEDDKDFYDTETFNDDKKLQQKIIERRIKLGKIVDNALLELVEPLEKINELASISILPNSITRKKPTGTEVDKLLDLMQTSKGLSEIANNSELLSKLAFILEPDSIMFKLIYSYKESNIQPSTEFIPTTQSQPLTIPKQKRAKKLTPAQKKEFLYEKLVTDDSLTTEEKQKIDDYYRNGDITKVYPLLNRYGIK